jgi:hypothetical protein
MRHEHYPKRFWIDEHYNLGPGSVEEYPLTNSSWRFGETLLVSSCMKLVQRGCCSGDTSRVSPNLHEERIRQVRDILPQSQGLGCNVRRSKIVLDSAYDGVPSWRVFNNSSFSPLFHLSFIVVANSSITELKKIKRDQ